MLDDGSGIQDAACSYFSFWADVYSGCHKYPFAKFYLRPDVGSGGDKRGDGHLMIFQPCGLFLTDPGMSGCGEADHGSCNGDSFRVDHLASEMGFLWTGLRIHQQYLAIPQ
jgi:hypothetical protein